MFLFGMETRRKYTETKFRQKVLFSSKTSVFQRMRAQAEKHAKARSRSHGVNVATEKRFRTGTLHEAGGRAFTTQPARQRK